MAHPPPSAPRAFRPFVPVTALHRYAFDDGDAHVDCGSAVLVTSDDGGFALEDEDDDFSIARAEQFLAGAPLTLGWVTRTPGRAQGESVYVYCWVTLGD